MRRGSDSAFMEDNGKLIAVNLGSDFVAEHEHSIQKLKENLGVNDAAALTGIERRRIHNSDGVLHWIDEGDDAALIVEKRYYDDKDYAIKDYHELEIYDFGPKKSKKEREDLVCAWCESSLGIHVRGEKNIKKLRKIYEAILNKDAAIWRGGGHVFQNAGLVIGIISNVPQENLKQMADADQDYIDLMAEQDKIGIKARIDKINEDYREEHGGWRTPFGYYALKPSWNKTMLDKPKTKYEIIYWLNPEGQDQVNFGWFTCEDLEAWIDGKGPIPMTEEQKAKHGRTR